MKFLSYTEYKLSDADWVGQIPRHWHTRRAKYLFREIVEPSTDGSERLLSVSEYYGVAPRDEKIVEGEQLTRAASLEGYKKCQRGDLVMNIMLAWKRGLGITDYEGVVSPSYSVFRLITDHPDPHYFGYLLRTNQYIDEFWRRSSGVINSRLRLYPEVFGRIPVLVPPPSEQRQIAAFLDYETARIDRLIEKQQRLIELLQEKRQATISHAVTKGLDPDVPMKDSGIEWLGHVPSHWRVISLKRIIRALESGVSVNAYSEPAGPNEIGILKTSCVYSRDFRPKENKKVLEEELTRVSCPARGGALIISRMNTPDLVGAAAYVSQDYPNLFLPDRLWQTILDPTWAWASRFLARITLTPYYRQSIASIASGTSGSMKNIAQEDLMNIRIAAPPQGEYEKIEQHLEKTEKSLRWLIDCATEMIDRLKEHRTALISAAVTGKIDVRDWQPSQSANEAEKSDDQLLQAAEERATYG